MMSLTTELNRVMSRMARIAPRLKRYADSGLSQRIMRKVEQAVDNKGLMETIMERRFYFQGPHGPHGSRWRPLTKNYLRWKIKKGYPRFIGVRTYALFKAAKKEARNLGWDFDRKTRWGENVVPSSVDYAGYYDDVRPFSQDPNAKEMEPVHKFAIKEVEKELRRIARG